MKTFKFYIILKYLDWIITKYTILKTDTKQKKQEIVLNFRSFNLYDSSIPIAFACLIFFHILAP